MAKARALDKRRKSIRNIRKITRTMELIATARFKKAMDRAIAATAYTAADHGSWSADLARSGLEVQPSAAEARPETAARRPAGADGQPRPVRRLQRRACCGWPAPAGSELQRSRAGASGWKSPASGASPRSSFRKIAPAASVHALRRPAEFDEVDVLANRYLEDYRAGQARSARRGLHEVRVRQPASTPSSRRCCRWADLAGRRDGAGGRRPAQSQYEFLPSAESILEEVVPTSFKVKLFKCFLDAAVSEQIARMVAMKAATENADDDDQPACRMTYNRARQVQITVGTAWKSSAASKPSS